MNEYYEKIDWSLIWSIIKDTVLPHMGTLSLNTILYTVLGFFLSIIYIIILSKKKVLKRKPKYYNWVVKLYIPLLIGVFLYFFGQIGFLNGVKKILVKEKETVVVNIYEETLAYAFESEESKDEFVTEIQDAAKDLKTGSIQFTALLKITSENYNTGNSFIDSGKDKLANFVINKYGDDIYKVALYAMLNAAGARAKVNISESLPYEEFSVATDFLLDVGYKDLEQTVKNKLTDWYVDLLNTQHSSMIKSIIILLIVLISIPLIEFFIYKKWIEPKFADKILAEKDV